MSTISEWLWTQEPMKSVERSFTEYMGQLSESVMDDKDIETDSGYAYCGCEDCETREIFAHLMPKFLDLYRNGFIRMETPTLHDRIFRAILGRSKVRGTLIHGKAGDSTPKSITELFDVEKGGSDYLFMGPMHTCICGCNVLHILASFDEDGEIGQYFTEAKCASCGSLLRAPTPIDGDE